MASMIQSRVFSRTLVLPLSVLFGVLAVAIVGALLTGTEISGVTGSVESLSSSSGNFLTRASTLFPLGFAFSAGMVSSVNPCGFAMLPAYLGLYLGDDAGEESRAGVPERLRRAVLVGSTVTAGFVVMFGIVGLPIGLGARGLVDIFPWVGMAIGLLLAGAGAWLVGGGNLYNRFAEQLSTRMGDASKRGVKGYFAFGLGYGTASLSCTLPIFLAMVGSSFTGATFLNSVLQFLLYGLGMGSVILVLTLSMAVFRSAMAGALRKAMPYVQRISAAMLLLAGAFIVYYWLTIGGLLDSFA